MKMFKLIRQVLNALLSSATYFFEDGSRIDYYVRLDILRYRTSEPVRRLVDISLAYDESSGLLRIKTNVVWKWRDPQVALNMWSDSGPALSEDEKVELFQKLRLFVNNQPRQFEPLEL